MVTAMLSIVDVVMHEFKKRGAPKHKVGDDYQNSWNLSIFPLRVRRRRLLNVALISAPDGGVAATGPTTRRQRLQSGLLQGCLPGPTAVEAT